MGQLDFQHGDDLSSAIWICFVADTTYGFGSVNGVKHFHNCIFLFLVMVELYAVGTSCVGSASGS